MAKLGRVRDKNSRLNKFSMTTVEVSTILELLTNESLTKFNVHAVQTAANDLKQKVKNLFLQRMPNANVPGISRKKYSDVLVDAVRQQSNNAATIRSDINYGRTLVSVLGYRSSASGTFRARFFEVGTKRNIKALRFLRDAANGYSMVMDVQKVLVSFIKGINHQAS